MSAADLDKSSMFEPSIIKETYGHTAGKLERLQMDEQPTWHLSSGARKARRPCRKRRTVPHQPKCSFYLCNSKQLAM